MRRMLLAYTVNEVGTWFGYVALAVGVYDHTHSAIATAGLFIARGLLPAVLAPLTVVQVERWQRRGALAAVYLLEGLLTLGLAALLWHFSLVGVLILVALDGVGAVTATAVVRATAANIAEQEEGDEVGQRRANASLNFAFMGSLALGPVIGGALVHAFGGPLALVADATSFLLCSALLVNLELSEADAGGSLRSQMADAWHHVKSLRALRTLLVTEAIGIVFFASVEPVVVIYAKATLSAGDFGLGLLFGCWGAGAALGAMGFATSLKRSLGPMLTLGTLLVGIGYVGLAAAPSLALACVATVVGGGGNGIQWPSFVSSVQALTPAEMQGRLMGAIGSMGVLCPSIGFALGGTIASLSSTRVAMLVAGSVTLVASVVLLRVAPSVVPTSSPQPSE